MGTRPTGDPRFPRWEAVEQLAAMGRQLREFQRAIADELPDDADRRTIERTLDRSDALVDTMHLRAVEGPPGGASATSTTAITEPAREEEHR